ncbi:hypothetical protein N9230_00885 [Akkermansiaceae bacterium]|nr:hypothetical protein [Akkermansiaceae bacterium]
MVSGYHYLKPGILASKNNEASWFDPVGGNAVGIGDSRQAHVRTLVGNDNKARDIVAGTMSRKGIEQHSLFVCVKLANSDCRTAERSLSLEVGD